MHPCLAYQFPRLSWSPLTAALSLLMILCVPQSARGQTFEAVAVFVDEAPVIDGKLDDAVWAEISPITAFVQVWPDEGAEPTEPTEVRIAYNRNYLAP